MTTLAVALLVSDANRVAVSSTLTGLVSGYTVGFVRTCCPVDPAPTWETPPSHWYSNDPNVDADIVQTWQDAVAEAEPEDALYGLRIFTAQNVPDGYQWALTNLASQGLMFVPDEE